MMYNVLSSNYETEQKGKNNSIYIKHIKTGLSLTLSLGFVSHNITHVNIYVNSR